jgi:hypothetical protein
MNQPCAATAEETPVSALGACAAFVSSREPGGGVADAAPGAGGGKLALAAKVAWLFRNAPCLPLAVVTLNTTEVSAPSSEASGAFHTNRVLGFMNECVLYRFPSHCTPVRL